MGWHRKVVTWFTPDEPKPRFVELCKEFNFNKATELTKSGRHFIVKYIRDAKNNRVGTLVAYLNEEGDAIRLGWSALNTVRDRWNKHVGLYHALRRAESEYAEDLPSVVYYEIGNFYNRATTYFLKNARQSNA